MKRFEVIYHKVAIRLSQLSFPQVKRVGNLSEKNEGFRTSRNDRLERWFGFISGLLTNCFPLITLLLTLSGPASAAEETKVLDLVFTVKDLGGKVQDLKIKETKTEIRIALAADVLFDFDKADIKPKAADALKQVSSVIRDKAKGSVRIEGHTDAKGSDAYNSKLSERRANSVRDWLVTKEGLKDVKFETRGFGAKKPVAPNAKTDGSDDPEGRQKNRRVEIVVKK